MGPDRGDSRTGRPAREDAIDVERLSGVLERHPVRLAVLFGSHAKGTQHVDSDLDVALEFESGTDPGDALLPLIADLTSAADDADVDVGMLSDLDPRIGISLCESGVLLLGTRERFEFHCRRFREQLRDEERKPTRDRFHELVESARQAVGPNA